MSILQKKKIDIPEPKEYDYSELKNDILACGLDYKSFDKRNKDLFTNLVVDSKIQNPVAVVCNKIESSFSKRELAYLLSKSTLLEMVKIQEKQLKKSENKK
jgi:hypothetical protein